MPSQTSLQMKHPHSYSQGTKMKVIENPDQWGYAIYRTVYTPQSDEHLSEVMEKLETYMELGCDDMDSRDELENVLIWDREKFNRATIDEVRKDFKREMLIPEMGDDEVKPDDDEETYNKKRILFYQKRDELHQEYEDESLFGEVNSKFCLLIDEEAFQSILNAPEPKEGMKINETVGFVKLVTTYKSSSRNEQWLGWAKIDFRLLYYYYEMDEIERQWDEMMPVITGAY